jgi:hypothetical protein
LSLHVRDSRICGDGEETVAQLTFKLSDPNAKPYLIWSRIYWRTNHAVDREFCMGLIFACHFGHVAVVKRSLEKGADVNAEGGEYGNALQATSSEYDEQIMKLLLDKGADVNLAV